MRTPPERARILLFRSGRHLRVALDALADAYPGCEVSVVATPSAEREVVEAGIPSDRLVIYDAGPRFNALAFLRGGTTRTLRGKRFDRVAVLWPDVEGTEQGNVDRTALVVSPRGFDAIAPDGTIIPRRTAALVSREVARAAWSLAVWAGLGVTLYGPAWLARIVRRPSMPPARTDA